MSEFICGFEMHLPLKLESKLFCACQIVSKETEPNSATCPTCLGMPGSKPVLNKKAVDFAVKLAFALNCKIEKTFFFSRKTYFYPDLAKNYQISQFELPIGKGGFVQLDSGKKIRISRLHLEEDPAALVHESGVGQSDHVLVDYNRSGNPLCEVVTEPDINSAEEAKEFLDKFNSIVSYLDIFDSDNFVVKADTNISIKGGQRVEVKNVTGGKNIQAALDYELKRQKAALQKDKKIEKETRGFDEATGTTFSLRKKESEEDYGFIADPDLPPIELDNAWLEKIKSSLPELAAEKAGRFIKKYKLKEYDAKVLASSKELAEIFEQAASHVSAEVASKFLTRELLGILNYNGLSLKGSHVAANDLIGLLKLIEAGKVSEKNAKQATIAYCLEKIPPQKYLEQNNLLIDMASADISAEVKAVLDANKKAVDDLRQGNTKSMNFLVGQVMRAVKGKADARQIQKASDDYLSHK